MIRKGTFRRSRYSGKTCSGKPGCFWSRFTAMSSKRTGALRWSDIRMSSSVYESFPPERQTITRSPAAIMPKSSIALPTELRNCACRRTKVREGRPSAAAALLKAGRLLCGGAVLSRFEVLCLHISHEGSRGQRFSRRALQQILNHHFRAVSVDVGTQPIQPAAELAPGKLLVERGNIGAQALVELCGDDCAQRIRGEEAERSDSPMDILQTAFHVIRRTNS